MNVMILTAMRSGSTYLANMLWATGVFSFPSPHSNHPSLKPQQEAFEYFAPNHQIDPWDVHGIPKTRELCEQYLKQKSNMPFKAPVLLKVLKEQFEYYMLDHNDRALLESLFPGTKYIWLERPDMLARAISAYQFFVTKMPHLWDARMQQEYRGKKIPWDAKGVLDVFYNHIKDCNWAPFLGDASFHYIEYDALLINPAQALEDCLTYLGYKPGTFDVEKIVAKQPKFKTERPETKEYIERLKKLLIKML